jgi:hypothetical protein
MNTGPFFLVLSLAAVVTVAATPTPARAAWQPGGAALSPSPLAFQSYSLRGLVADGADCAFAAWEFEQPLPDFSGSVHALAAQRVDVLGNRPAPWGPGGTTIRSWVDNGSFGTYSIEPLRMLDDAAGGAILPVVDHTFTVEQMNLFRLYHLAPGGVASPIPGAGDLPGFVVLGAAADADGAGGVVMIAHRQTFALPPGPPPPNPLFVQRVDGTGNLLWPAGPGAPGPVLVPAGQSRVGGGLAALADGAGGAFFAWIDVRDSGDPDVYVQHVDANGGIVSGWPAGGVPVCDAPGAQSEVRLASDGAGGVIVVWRDERDPISHLYAHAVLASGTPAPGIPADGRQLPSSGTDDRFVEMAADGMGGCFVVRATMTLALQGVSCLHALDAAMEPRPGWPAEGIALNTLSASSGIVALLPDGLGGVFVSYRNGFGNVAPQGLYAQHFAADASPAPGWSIEGYRLSGTGLDSRIVRSGTGAIVAWNDYRQGGQGVYAQRILLDGPVATQLSLVSASADDRGVSLRWFAAGGAGLSATVERRTEGPSWTRLAGVTADGTGMLACEDLAVVPGARYGYRVTWLDGTSARTGGETWITVPLRATLALAAPHPNPASGGASVTLTLPDGRGARLDLLDLAGRRLFSRDLAGLGPGRHVVPLDEAAALAPGIYTLRLAEGGAVKLARLCVVR